jgi:hypothetical protein
VTVKLTRERLDELAAGAAEGRIDATPIEFARLVQELQLKRMRNELLGEVRDRMHHMQVSIDLYSVRTARVNRTIAEARELLEELDLVLDRDGGGR